MLACLLSAALAASASPYSPLLEPALGAAVARAGAHAEIAEVRVGLVPGCLPTSAQFDRPIDTSGHFVARLSGKDASGAECQGWAWVRVRLLARVLVASRAIQPGEKIRPAAAAAERELLRGFEPLTEASEDAVASRRISAGAIIEGRELRSSAPIAGEELTVVVRAGPVSIVQPGRAVSCVRGRVCAQLPSGRRVEGRFEGGRLLVEVP